MPPVAQAATDAAEAVPSVVGLVEYGVLGILVAALFSFAYMAYRREASRADRLELENRELRNRTEERVIPLLHRALDLIERPLAGGSRWRDRVDDDPARP